MKSSKTVFTVFLSIFLLLISCSKDSDNPTGPDEQLDITISLSVSEANPGNIITLITSSVLSPIENYELYFGDKQSPIINFNEENEYRVMVPNASAGTVDVYLKNKKTSAISKSISFKLLPLTSTGLSKGEVVSEIIEFQKNSSKILKNVIIPNLNTIGDLSTNNLQLFSTELDRSISIFESMEQKIQTLSDNEKELLDQILYSSGILDLVAQGNKSLKKIVKTTSTNSRYNGHHICAAMDGFSAILTAINNVWTIAGLIASVGSGGSLAPIVIAGSVAITIIDNGIDGFLPTDLEELFIDAQQDITVPLNGSNQIRIMGKFVPQSNPINATIDTFISTLLGLIDIGVAKSFIVEILTSMGLNVADNITKLTENWQSIVYVNHRINPSYYEGGFGTFLSIFGEYLNISISGGSFQDFLSAISGFNYHVSDAAIASFDDANSSISGLQTGSSKLIYNGYRFKSLGGWAGLFTLGTEWPILLDESNIEECHFTVQQMAGNSIIINSIPSGAAIYLDGTNMNQTTPATLNDVDAGYHHIRLYKFGYNEYNEYFTLQEGGSFIINADLGAPLPPLPVFTIYSPQNGEHFSDNVISVSGLIQLKDAYGNTSSFDENNAILTLNGIDQDIPISNGNFNQEILINSGENHLSLRANSTNGNTGISDEIIFYGDFSITDIQIILRWNNGTDQYGDYPKMKDVDLHVFDSDGHHTYWLCSDQYSGEGHDNAVANMIPGSVLDIDNIWGFGPETFTLQNSTNTVYTVKAHFYSGYDASDPTDANIEIILKNNSNKTYGPYRFKNSYRLRDSDGYYLDNTTEDDPDCWWDVVSFTVSGGLPKIVQLPSKNIKLSLPFKSKRYYLKGKNHGSTKM